MARLFVAIEVPSEVREALATAVSALGKVGNFKWTKPANYHLTLAFLGQADPLQVTGALADIEPTGATLELRTAGQGGFPRDTSARVLFEGVYCERIEEYVHRIRAACRPVAPDMDEKSHETRYFIPHLTLGRSPSHENIEGLDVSIAAMTWRTDTYSLIESKLSPRGATYETRATFRF